MHRCRIQATEFSVHNLYIVLVVFTYQPLKGRYFYTHTKKKKKKKKNIDCRHASGALLKPRNNPSLYSKNHKLRPSFTLRSIETNHITPFSHDAKKKRLSFFCNYKFKK
ncbi:hypothetical protein Hanom_Chr12g01117461 [Helianthus anomalus]